MAWRVDVATYRRLTVVLLGGSAVLAAGAAALAARGRTIAAGAVGLVALSMAGATFALRVRGDLRGETILLLSRRECTPCLEARTLLSAWQDELGHTLWVVDVDEADASVRDEYTARVPVVMHRGKIVMELDVQAPLLRAALLSR